ncbi:MAG: hypothetical protein QM607_05315 [Microbacterium sp.]
MAVAAPYFALGDLVFDGGHAETVCDESHHFAALLVPWQVIEIEHPKIADAAIDAGVRSKVGHEEGLRFHAFSLFALAHDLEVLLAIVRIVGSR